MNTSEDTKAMNTSMRSNWAQAPFRPGSTCESMVRSASAVCLHSHPRINGWGVSPCPREVAEDDDAKVKEAFARQDVYVLWIMLLLANGVDGMFFQE